MQRLAGRRLFTVGKQEYRGEDLALAACIWGDLTPLRRQIREGIACQRRAHKLGGPGPEASDEELADTWRYERDLLSADDLQSWLDRRRLSMDEWLEFIHRSALRRRWSAELPAIARSHRVSPEEIDALLYAEAVCTGRLAELADKLAGHASIYDRLIAEAGSRRRAPCSKADVRAVLKALPSDVRKEGILGVGPRESLERAEFLACVMLCFERFIDRAAAPAAVEREIEAHALEWTRLDCQTASFASEEQAREAILVVREDGLGLQQAAAMAKANVEAASFLLEEAPAAMKERLLGALPGQIVGPVATEDTFLLISVQDRVEPSRKDRSIRRRARDQVIRRTIQREIEKRVRWHEHL